MSTPQRSILACVDAEIDRCLFNDEQIQKGFRYEHKRSYLALGKEPPDHFDGYKLISAIYNRIEKNLMRRPQREPSPANWKFRPTTNEGNLKTDANNKSEEVTLERAIVQRWPQKWTYQMPVASGLFGEHTDKRRAVDLVHIKDNDHFDFVELKIKSDTPLYATMEILGYGLVYLASRKDFLGGLKYGNKEPVLSAKKINLVVLAPREYYGEYNKEHNIKWLQQGLDNNLNKFIKNIGVKNLEMNFRFEMFPKDFKWEIEMQPSLLPDNLHEHVYP